VPQPASKARRRTTITDVARLASVDPSVVSRVINADDRLTIKDETRRRVLDAIETLGYHPNAAARSLRTAQSGTFGLLIPDFANPIYAEIIKGAEEAATAHGALLLTGTALEGRPGRYVELVASGRVDGLLLASDRLNAEAISAVVRSGKPIVSVNQRIPGVASTIIADDGGAAVVAVEHLVSLGHTKIGHIRGPAGSDTARRRLAGYRKAMKRAGLQVDAGQIVESNYTAEGGFEAMTSLLGDRAAITAVLVANVAAAIGALAAARALGVAVPAEISVVAIHDNPLAEYLAPPLTTVRLPLAELGAVGVRTLIQGRSATGGTTVVSEPTELMLRKSTCAPRRDAWPNTASRSTR
jgi:DNA-binding LacI/PurR family transcriptional regulator